MRFQYYAKQKCFRYRCISTFCLKIVPLLYFRSGHRKKKKGKKERKKNGNPICYDDDVKRKFFGNIIDNLLDLACLVSCRWLDVKLRLHINDKYFSFGIRVTLLHATMVSAPPFPP